MAGMSSSPGAMAGSYRDRRKKIFERIMLMEWLHGHKHHLLEAMDCLNQIKRTPDTKRGTRLTSSLATILSDAVKNVDELMLAQMETRFTHDVVDINRTIKSVLASFRQELRSRQDAIRIHVDLSGQLPTIHASETEVRQLAFELLSNAIEAIQSKANRSGTVTVSTRVVEVSQRAYIELAVLDSGPGIERGDKTWLSFKESDGLFLARRIVEQSFGGTIVFESVLGQGTNVLVRIPRKRFEV